jgi:hypothetical protein
MNRKLITVSVSAAVLAFGAASAAAQTTVIGSTGQSNNQAVNSTQSGENGSGGGNTYVLGNSAPTTTQVSVNALSNDQEIGGGPAATTLIAPAPGQCFCQSNQQGVNSQQVGVNGDGSSTAGSTTAILGNSAPTLTQVSVNPVGNFQAIGGGPGPTILIGGAAQANQQGANSSQSGENGSGGGGTLVIGGASRGALTQISINPLFNDTILGG